MKGFEQLFLPLRQMQELKSHLEHGSSPALAVGLSGVQKAVAAASLMLALGRPGLILCPQESDAHRLTEDLKCLLGEEAVLLYPQRDYTLTEVEGVSREYEQERLRVLSRLAAGPVTVVASVSAAIQRTMPREELARRTLSLKPGDRLPVEQLLGHLLEAGYESAHQVEGPGQFSRRGGIVDLFSPQQENPCRIEYWDDEIDTISTFSVETQRRMEGLPRLDITPGREVIPAADGSLAAALQARLEALGGREKPWRARVEQDLARLKDGLGLASYDRYLELIYPGAQTLLDYCSGHLVFLSESANLREAVSGDNSQLREDIALLLEKGELPEGCGAYLWSEREYVDWLRGTPAVIFDSFARSVPEIPLAQVMEIRCRQLSTWSGDLGQLREDLDYYLQEGYRVVIAAGTERAAKALRDDLVRMKYHPSYSVEIPPLQPGQIAVTTGTLSAGFEFTDLGLAFITHAKTAAQHRRRQRRDPNRKAVRDISDLTVGDYVVHSAHGIGIFSGIVKRTIQGVTKDYLQIKYAGTDTLFVPVTQLDLVARYVGPREDGKIRLNRLNSAEWQKTRQRVKSAVRDMARELIAIYSQRLGAKGFAFSQDSDWQREFEERFPYEETEDQLVCAAQIKEDMEKPVPMDRLLCGDVGFGKTEVALRAVFKCVMDSKQCAVLVPTTILAWQHYQTFLQRLEGFPITVELLSRFRSAKEQKETIARLKTGEVDVVIGTHRLLQKDVVFKDLGLCVIDEEQRFGVAHKERFKELKNSVDVLTLSATPIPRTLNMAMSGIRDMSVIEQAPQDRQPVQTYVIEHDWAVITQAIRRELRRGGQVFYLHNVIDSISGCAARLQELLPDARIGVAHGRMGEEELSRVWRALMEQEIDILVCTTIIETGVDVTNCNTLIIEDADRMGLSQLYQIRGRVGRGSRRAFAYFTFRRGKSLSDVASKRLEAIRDFTSFGSGFRIAMRDMEIRGAGNILGAKQHGHMESVGYDMYVRLLSQAVEEERGETPKAAAECMIDIAIEAHIPEDYIEDLSQRIDIYKKIAAIQSEQDALDVTDELIDRFGDPPAAVQGLIQVALVRGRAALAGIQEISQRGGSVLFYPEQVDMARVSRLSAAMKGRVLLSMGMRPYLTVKIAPSSTALETIAQVVEILLQEPPAGPEA